MPGNKSAYQVFDEVMKRAGEEPAPGGYKSIVDKIADLAEYLPQFEAIQKHKEDQHRRWAKKTVLTELKISLMDRRVKMNADVLDLADQQDFENAWRQSLWHLRRASGIGGSEVGDIIMNLRGQSGGFGSAANTVKEKLLILAPQVGEAPMRRGHRMEDFVRAIHHQSSGEIPDEKSLASLRGFRSEKNPYIIGTPDDITLRYDDKKKERVLLDYKCPSVDVIKGYVTPDGTPIEVPFAYVAQLHHYGVVAKDAGIKINAYQLVPFDYRDASTPILPVEHDKAFEEELLEGTKVIWNEYVMKGEIPDLLSKPVLEPDNEGVNEAIRKAGVMKVVYDQIGQHLDQLKNDALMLSDDSVNKNAVGLIDAGFAFVGRKAVPDEERLVSLAEQAGIDSDDYMVPSKSKVNNKVAANMISKIHKELHSGDSGAAKRILKIITEDLEGSVVLEMNTDDLIADLVEMGVDVTNAYTVKENFGLTRKKFGPNADLLAEVQQDASLMVNEIREVVEKNMENIVEGLLPKDEDEAGISF